MNRALVLGKGRDKGEVKMVEKNEMRTEERRIISEGKIYAVIGYLWILCFITLMVKKDNKFAVFHAKQGLVVFLSWLFLLVISIVPVIGPIIGFVGMVMLLVLSLMGIMHALRGEYWIMPFIGGKAEEINI